MGSLSEPVRGIRIAIDRGGTFTDVSEHSSELSCSHQILTRFPQCVASVPGQEDILIKLLSVDPSNYPDAPVEAIRRVLEKAMGRSYPKGEKISLEGVGA